MCSLSHICKHCLGGKKEVREKNKEAGEGGRNLGGKKGSYIGRKLGGSGGREGEKARGRKEQIYLYQAGGGDTHL